MTFPRASKQNAADIATATHHFKQLAIGEVLPYATLSGHMGFDVRDRRYPIDKARWELWGEQLFIGVVSGVGFKRLTHEEAAKQVWAAPRRIRNIAKKASRKAASIDPGSVPAEVFQRTVATASGLNVIAHLTKEASQKKLAAGAVGGADADYQALMKASIDKMK